MKLQRWFLFSLWSFSILALTVAATWWWMAWPRRTAQALAASMIEKKFATTFRNGSLEPAYSIVSDDGAEQDTQVAALFLQRELIRNAIGLSDESTTNRLSTREWSIKSVPGRSMVDRLLARGEFCLCSEPFGSRSAQNEDG
jgi:hypothetical protein